MLPFLRRDRICAPPGPWREAHLPQKWARIAVAPTPSRRMLFTLLFFVLVPSGINTGLVGQQLQATEAQVKAAYLFNFGKYVSWPPISGEHFLICVLGRDPFGSVLDEIVAGEKIASKQAEVRRIRSFHDASSCQMLFIASSEDAQIRSVLPELANVPVLLVSDLPGFVERGGMIQFVTEGNRVRFLVNLKAAQRVGLTLSSELLKVAKSVQRDTPGVL
jgi:hypothetical protein